MKWTVLCCLLLAGCSTTHELGWQRETGEYLANYQHNKLTGNEGLAARNFVKALDSASHSGNIEAYNHVILYKCAIDQAAFSGCAERSLLYAEYLTTAQKQYQHFLAAEFDGIDTNVLPSAYRDFFQALKNKGNWTAALTAIDLALPRLIAATIVLKQQPDNLKALEIADRTASNQGWRTPLKIIVGKLRNYYQKLGDMQAVKKLETRLVILESP